MTETRLHACEVFWCGGNRVLFLPCGIVRSSGLSCVIELEYLENVLRRHRAEWSSGKDLVLCVVEDSPLKAHSGVVLREEVVSSMDQ